MLGTTKEYFDEMEKLKQYEALCTVKELFTRNEEKIKYLEEENNKDEKFQKVQERLDEMQKEYWRGFPITEAEEKAIKKWKKKHDKEVHGLITDIMRMKAGGCSGGRYSYHFVPTALGTSGVIKCHCGAKFEFQKIG